jgi:lysophospholipase L1-like esterase
MKLFFCLTLSVILLSMKGVQKTKIIFFGDSITQMGVNKNGYIEQIGDAIKAKGQQDQFELLGAGIGGNKVYDLYLRLEDDVLNKDPQVVMIYVGINDVWHKTSGTGTDLDKYEKFYNALITKLQAKKIKVLVCTPTVIGELKNGANPQDADLEKYSAVVRKLAASRKCQLVDLRKAFQEYIELNNSKNTESGILTTDRVHLNKKGNEIVAKEIMKVLGI